MNGTGFTTVGEREKEQSIRVLMTADNIGNWTYVLELAEALGKHGVSVGLATMGSPLSALQRTQVTRLSQVTLFECRFSGDCVAPTSRPGVRSFPDTADLEAGATWPEVAAAGEWLLRIAAEFRPTVIHLNNSYVHAALPWPAPVIVVAHSCVFSWWLAVKGQPAPKCYEEYHSRVCAGLKAADLVIAPTAAMLDSLEEIYGLALPDCVIPNFRGSKPVSGGLKKIPAIHSSGPITDEAKNIGLLKKIGPFLCWPMHVGAASAGSAATSIPGRGALGPGSAAIYAAPALYEPSGLEILEAALCSCALVLGDLPSLRENWSGAAIFLPPEDEAAWCGTLNLLAADERARAELGARARARASRFHPNALSAKYLAAYEAVAAGRPGVIIPTDARVLAQRRS